MIFHNSRALVLTGALAYPVAVAAHLLVHAIGAGASFVFATPSHGVMLATAALALALAAHVCGAGRSGAEIRRRSALIGAGARADGGLGRAVALQALLITALLVAENASIAPGRLAEAIACGALSSLFAALAVRALRAGLPRALVSLHAVHRSIARAATALAVAEPARALHLAHPRVRPVRAPPIR